MLTPFSCTSIYPHIYSKLSYDPVRDFTPVSIAAIMHHGLAIGPLVPASVKTVKEFLAWAKANPNQASYGSPAAGSTPHFIAEADRHLGRGPLAVHTGGGHVRRTGFPGAHHRGVVRPRSGSVSMHLPARRRPR